MVFYREAGADIEEKARSSPPGCYGTKQDESGERGAYCAGKKKGKPFREREEEFGFEPVRKQGW